MNHPYFLLIIAPLIWGGHAVIGKLAAGEITPMTMTFLRWLGAFLVLLPFALPKVKKDWQTLRPALGWLIVYGGFGFTLFNLFFYMAANHTSAVNITLIQASVPMIIILINRFFFGQTLVFIQLAGLFLTLIGVLFIVTRGDWLILTTFRFNLGDIYMLFAALSYAIYSVLLRYNPAVHWLSFVFIASGFATLVAMPFSMYEILYMDQALFNLSVKTGFLLIYVIVLASIVAQTAYAKAVSLIGAGRAGFSLNLVPVFGALMAVIFLNESFYWFHWVGLILVLGGIALSEQSAKRDK